ncbi:MAG: hypothetical protein M1826_001652 [Phylliscum demangeonii]|nr:MAG: hypothetical protein M1826_001652 [Phylliscum demangeonii]
MTTLLEVAQREYRSVWSQSAYGNVSIINDLDNEDCRRWLRAIRNQKKAPDPPPPSADASLLASSDCTVFALKTAAAVLASQANGEAIYWHGGVHGAVVLRDGEDFVVLDSMAKSAFKLEDGEEHVLSGGTGAAKRWKCIGDVLCLDKPDGPLKRLANAEEMLQSARRYWLTKKELVILFRCWEQENGAFRGIMKFRLISGYAEASGNISLVPKSIEGRRLPALGPGNRRLPSSAKTRTTRKMIHPSPIAVVEDIPRKRQEEGNHALLPPAPGRKVWFKKGSGIWSRADERSSSPSDAEIDGQDLDSYVSGARCGTRVGESTSFGTS